jgi:hypothetical protein
MAKNWKKAHDKVVIERDTAERQRLDAEHLVGMFKTELNKTRSDLRAAVTLIHGACENLRAHGITDSSRALRDSIERIAPRPDAAAEITRR